MATYPAGIYSHTSVVDNVDYPQATHINTPAAETVAIETELGTNPKSIDDTVTPGASPASVAAYLDMVANLLKRIMGAANWYTFTAQTHTRGGTISSPGTYYSSVGAVVPIFQAPAALTITKIIVKSDDSTPTSEIAGDLKFADDIFTGSLANATVIDVCDTTSGSFEATSSFDDATVPSGKYIYFQFDSAPHADHKRVLIQFNFTYD